MTEYGAELLRRQLAGKEGNLRELQTLLGLEKNSSSVVDAPFRNGSGNFGRTEVAIVFKLVWFDSVRIVEWTRVSFTSNRILPCRTPPLSIVTHL